MNLYLRIFSLESQGGIMDNHLRAFIKRMISLQEERGGFSIEDLPLGTKISVETRNSIYEIEIIKDSKILIMGGVLKDSNNIRFPKPVEAILTGSTWGTSLLKRNWLGEEMRMEIFYEGVLITTSPIKNVIINPVSGRAINLHWN